MWRAPTPVCSAKEMVSACAADIGLRDRKRRLLDSIPELKANNRKYRRRLREGRAHRAKPSDFPLSMMSGAEMKAIYNRKVVGEEGSRARDLYERLKSNAKRGRCPYCNCNQPETLDHYFPKTTFPTLAIDPWNLVPACRNCNSEMLAALSDKKSELFFHPYFECVDDAWLKVAVLEQGVPAAVFSAEPASGCDPTVADRIRYQFDSLGLEVVYATALGGAVADIRRQLRRIHAAAGADGVAKHLNEYAESIEENGLNEWRAVLFRALAENDWYCGGGFDEW